MKYLAFKWSLTPFIIYFELRQHQPGLVTGMVLSLPAMTRRAKAIIGGVVAAVAGAAAYFVAEGASVPVSMAAQTDSSFDAQWEKVGTFEKEWQGDGSLLVVAWVGHTGGDSPDVSTARASWRGSSLRLSYSTNSPELRRMSMAIYKLSFRVTSLPKQEYQVSWGDWFSSRVAETRRGK